MDFFLRPWREDDIPSIARYANNPKIACNLRNSFPFPYTEEDARHYIMACIRHGDHRQLCRTIEINGEAAGSIGISLRQDVYEKTAEIGYWLAEPYWRHGIMSTAVRMLCEEAFSRFDLLRIYAEPFAKNQGSRRTLEKAGFVLEGVLRQNVFKNGQVLDSCLYALLRKPN